MILIPVSPGELWDKISILELKLEFIKDPVKLEWVQRELDLLTETQRRHCPRDPELDELVQELKSVNRELWHIEEGKRRCEANQQFGAHFVELARRVYLKNDRRAALKQRINQSTDSNIQEVKSY